MPERNDGRSAKVATGAQGSGTETVGVLPTNFAYVQMQFGDFSITNIDLKKDPDQAMKLSKFNSYISSFSCKRGIPKGLNGKEAKFWNDSGGSLSANVTIIDPSFVQFENIVISSIKEQKSRVKIIYGLSSQGGGVTPPPFQMDAIITSMTQSISEACSEWQLELSPVPEEFFDEELKKKYKKDPVIKLNAGDLLSEKISKLLEEQRFRGLVFRTKPLKSGKKIPTKDYGSILTLIRNKLVPMCSADDDTFNDPYNFIVALDGSVFLIPNGMSISEALNNNNCITFGGYSKEKAKEDDKKYRMSIEQQNMRQYMSDDNGILTLKYGFENSIVKSLDISYDCLSMIMQYNFLFTWTSKSGEIKSFSFPKDPIMDDKKKIARVMSAQLYADSEEEALETAKAMIRKMNVFNYQGTATLINWPYIALCQGLKFEYYIPNGAKIAKNVNNTVDQPMRVFGVSNKPDDRCKSKRNPKQKKEIKKLEQKYLNDYLGNADENAMKKIKNNWISLKENGKWDVGYSSNKTSQSGKEYSDEKFMVDLINSQSLSVDNPNSFWRVIPDEKRKELERKAIQESEKKYPNNDGRQNTNGCLTNTPKSVGNELENKKDDESNQNESLESINQDDYYSNMDLPVSLQSWSDTAKSSQVYYVQSIEDTIEGGIIISKLELKNLVSESNPQLYNKDTK